MPTTCHALNGAMRDPHPLLECGPGQLAGHMAGQWRPWKWPRDGSAAYWPLAASRSPGSHTSSKGDWACNLEVDALSLARISSPHERTFGPYRAVRTHLSTIHRHKYVTSRLLAVVALRTVRLFTLAGTLVPIKLPSSGCLAAAFGYHSSVLCTCILVIVRLIRFRLMGLLCILLAYCLLRVLSI